MILARDITGLILAGGKGSRMGHTDKGLLPFRGMALTRHAIACLSPQAGELMIAANRNEEIYRAFGVQLCPDAISDYAGPLAGMQAGLIHCATPYMATAPCDSPFLPHDLVPRLAQALIAEGADAAVARTAEGIQPVFCLLKTTLLPLLNAFLQNGGRKVEAWQATLKIAMADFEDAVAFRNLNTPEDLRNYEAA